MSYHIFPCVLYDVWHPPFKYQPPLNPTFSHNFCLWPPLKPPNPNRIFRQSYSDQLKHELFSIATDHLLRCLGWMSFSFKHQPPSRKGPSVKGHFTLPTFSIFDGDMIYVSFHEGLFSSEWWSNWHPVLLFEPSNKTNHMGFVVSNVGGRIHSNIAIIICYINIHLMIEQMLSHPPNQLSTPVN